MSIYRSLVRMAAVTALNNFMQEPWPTLAGPYIFDSKIEPVEDMKHDRAFPCVVVYTDYDKDQWAKAGKVHSDRIVSLTLELLVVQSEPEDKGYKLECPSTDSEIEAALDTLEEQVFRALHDGGVSSDTIGYICPSYQNTTSRRGATVEGGLRLAARQISIEMKAIRGPMNGVIPAQISDFLDRIETFDDYKDRVPDIRALLTANATSTPNEIIAKMLGYPRHLATILGAPTGPQVRLTTPIVYHKVGGVP